MPPRVNNNNVMDPSEWVKPKQQRPARRSLYEALRKEKNVKCLILTGLIYGCIVAIAWCRVTRVTKVDIDFTAFPITSTREISPCDDGSIYIPTAFVVMLYLLYLVECWHCKAWHQLKFEKTDLNSAYQKIHEVRQAQPVVWWKAVCYHYVRRTREITRYRNGNAYTCTQVYYERVNSHVAAGCFFFALCGMKDVSRELMDLEKHAATKIQLSKGFLFANLETAREFQEQRAAFFQEQERYDDYMEMREGMDLSNVHFKESLISWTSPDNPPWFAKISVFWLCNFLLLSWPLRLILELNTAHVHYQVNKLFGVNYMSPSVSERLLSAPRSHGLPINNHQQRIHNRAISSHHSRLNNTNHRQRRTNVDVDHDDTAPLLSSATNNSNHQHQDEHHLPDDFLVRCSAGDEQEPNQYFNSTTQQYSKSEKDSSSQELQEGGSSKNLQLHKDQHSNDNDNSNDNNNSTNHNNNNIISASSTTPLATTSPSSSSFFPWRSSFFTRNFRFARQSGYKLTRSVTLLMTKPEKLEFLATAHNRQRQFPDEFGYYGDSDEGARLLHDESYYPSCSSPPPPPFLTPSPEEEEEEQEGDNCQQGDSNNGQTSHANNDNTNDHHNRSSTIAANSNRHHHSRHHRSSLAMTPEEGEHCVDGNADCLAPSYSQALLSMEPNERSCVLANFHTNYPESSFSTTSSNGNPSLSSTRVSSSLPPPTSSVSVADFTACTNSSTEGTVEGGFGTANLTNEQENPPGFMNVTGIRNDSLCTSSGMASVGSAMNKFAGELHGQVERTSVDGGTRSRHNNCPAGTTTANSSTSENPPSIKSGNHQQASENSCHNHYPQLPLQPPPISQVTQENGHPPHYPLGNHSSVEDAGDSHAVVDDLSFSQERTNLVSSSSSNPQQQPSTSLSSSFTTAGHRHHYHRTASMRLPSSGSSLVLNTVAPREVTGVQIDLTQPIVVTVPRDPLRESAALAAMSENSSSSSSSCSANGPSSSNHSRDNPNAHFGRDDEPPTYFEALKTSRPVFLPTLARIRRCFTERDIASRFSSNRSWLNEIADVEGGFVHPAENIAKNNKNGNPTTSTAQSNRQHNRGHGGSGSGCGGGGNGGATGNGSSTSQV